MNDYLYPQCHQTIELHQDKASSHTSQSTVNFVEKMEQVMGAKIVPFSDISAKSPDVSPVYFYAFDLLRYELCERRLTTLFGLWKAVQEEWDNILLPILQ
ncbi:hypothetical protein AVEN_104469-1 [Araneus ventricosus]|uniref:Mariner Mos1 transposase n=1 Tax=Araneus ventricosus TaxID=182803 RepID=A0A4Y2G2F9_ARAVE|nr:hypothetical protein AVEN_18918-1 [Araneus ventricosus]GBM47913.1 hypothetical protein AVEN_34780-1 [Araneus ventricosus]GBM47931.1 hypothetical protein AVEN_104469-1 [Araneus ventricosus]